jgi:hypothetical protein
VVDGKHYHLDQYLEKAFEGNLTPLEMNIYHAGNTDPSLLPRPFQIIDYSTTFGKAFFNAQAKDPTWTKCRGTGGQPSNTHPLGYILFQRPGKRVGFMYLKDLLHQTTQASKAQFEQQSLQKHTANWHT